MIDEWHYRKKPVVVEAFQLSDEIGAENPLWIIASMQEGNFRMATGGWEVVTLEGVMLAGIGDWIIKGTKGEIYPCKPDIFAEIYEPVSAGPGQFIEKVVALTSECHRLAGSIELGAERERMFSIYSVLHNLGRAGYAEEVCRRMNPLVPADVCVWTYDDADYHWQTACGSAWAFTEGDPKENGCNFCHSCGKQLVTADGGDDE